MAEKRIIIAEDDVSTGIMLFEFLTSRGYAVEAVKDGSEALKKFKENPAQVVITDIEMPVMDGNELIGHLKRFEIPPVIFVTTSHKDPGLIIDIMKKGVFDYILKPVDMSDLLLKLNRAFETYDLKRAFEIAQKEKVIRLENSLEWYKFEERVQSRDLKAMGKNIFDSLLTSFNQGSGFGGLVTLVAVMKSTAVKDGEYYKIKDELYDMIMDNVTSAEKALQTFSDISKIGSGLHEPEKISLAKLHDEISNKIKELDPLIIKKNHHLMLSDKKAFFSNMEIEINLGYFMKAFDEIVLNSLKFSPSGSKVAVLFLSRDDVCSISVINDILVNENNIKGIPMGHENLVFEPFYRLTKTVSEGYNTLDYGLGLTLAEKIVTKYGGTIAIGNIADHSDIKAEPRVKVECTMTFPAGKI
jgi:FixJ family two-component response regulator